MAKKNPAPARSAHRLIIFDFDGTLADTVGGILATANIMAKMFNKKPFSRKKIALTIGTGLANFLWGLFPGEYQKRGKEKMIKIYRKIYDKKYVVGLRTFPGVNETLRALKQKKIKLVIVSNKLKRYVVGIVKRMGAMRYFDAVMGSSEQKFMKPNPWSITFYMKKYGVKRGEVMMVGDSQYDVETGKRAKVTTVFLTHGYADMKIVRKLKPEYYLNNIKGLIKII